MGNELKGDFHFRQNADPTIKRLLIIESNFCVGGIIHDLLKCICTDLDVLLLPQADQAKIDSVMLEFVPNIVIMDDTTPNEVLIAILILSIRFPDLKVVMISADSNRVEVFNTQSIKVGHLQDFWAIF